MKKEEKSLSDVKQIAEKLLSSDVKADLLSLFHKNPELSDAVDGLAKRIGRSASEIESEMKDLLELGILRTKKVGKLDVISFDKKRDRKIQQAISKLLRERR